MKVQLNGFVAYEKPWDGEGHGFRLMGFDPTGTGIGCVLVKEQTFEVEVPDNFDPRSQMVKELEAAKEKARQDFAATVARIDRQINELLALEHSN